MDPDPTEFPARLFDGRSALPHAGRVRLDGAELRFLPDQGAERAWRLRDVCSVQRVAGEVHAILPGEDRAAPEPRLSVLDPRFEDAIDRAQRRFGGSLRTDLQRAGRRISLGGWILIAAVAIPLAFGAYTVLLPRLHVFVPPEKEAALGELVFDALRRQWKPLEDEAFERVVAPMVAELRDPGSPFDLRVALVDQDEINAVALPGGRILVFRGLVAAAPGPDALAAVLAHEIAHVEERHGLQHVLRSLGLLHFAGGAVGGGIDGFETAETLVELSSGLLILEHSRAHEREADELALAKLRRAGRNPLGLAEFFEVVKERYGDLPEAIGWLSTHPRSAERIEEVRSATAGPVKARPWMEPAAWEEFRARYRE